jgi:hypothetical protein
VNRIYRYTCLHVLHRDLVESYDDRKGAGAGAKQSDTDSLPVPYSLVSLIKSRAESGVLLVLVFVSLIDHRHVKSTGNTSYRFYRSDMYSTRTSSYVRVA